MLSATLRLTGRRVHLVRNAGDCEGCQNHAAHVRLDPRSFLQSQIGGVAHGDDSTLTDFRDLASAYGLLHDVHRVNDSQVLEHVAWLLQTERLIAVECPVQYRQSPMAEVPSAPPIRTPVKRQPVEEPTKTWVEIELLDALGKPVPNEPYVVTVPEGTKKTGNLDGQGRARISGIDPGMCQISFPEIDGREWS